TLFNDNGVFKPQQGMAQVDRSAIASAKISLRGESIANARDWLTEQSLPISNGVAKVTLAAGGIAVVELTTAR
ncbi:MAG TPA: hypothetical protein VHD88_08795, partial [Pyrinomonadaceae bacterium]|nr:hypothetical protein [Pyrinomonadaceae bacterium]